MNLTAIAHAICDQADEFLAGVTRRDEARAGIAEYLTLHHSGLSPADRQEVVNQTMRILEREDFFSTDPGSGGAGAEAGEE